MSTTTTLTRLAAPLAATALLVAGCSDDGDSPDVALDRTTPPVATSPTSVPPASPTPTSTAPSDDQREWATCTSSRAGLTVSHPADWTVRDRPDGGCAYFDPQPFEVQRGTEAPAVAVRLDVEPVAYDRVREGYLRGEVREQREVEVAGYPGIRVEDDQTQGPLGAKGHRVTYLADLGGDRTLVLTTNETDARDFEQAQEVLDEMADRLERS